MAFGVKMARFSFSRERPPIALLTDFGYKDNYVGVMKGVIHSLCPQAAVIDLSHNILPQDVAEAAFVLSSAYAYFPEGTIFVCVVDPGVGSGRPIVCARINGRTFLAPDNGLLGVVASRQKPKDIYEVSNEKYFLREVSGTFHGRDIFAPVAAHLASGVSPSGLGRKLSRMRKLRVPKPILTADGRLRGEVIYIDQFGNLITNISDSALSGSFQCSPDKMAVTVKRRRIKGLSKSYSAGQEGELVALVGSSGYLEVAVNKASAEDLLSSEKGDSVSLSVLETVS